MKLILSLLLSTVLASSAFAQTRVYFRHAHLSCSSRLLPLNATLPAVRQTAMSSVRTAIHVIPAHAVHKRRYACNHVRLNANDLIQG